MKKIAPSAELRHRAWNAMSATWPTVLALSCAINLVTSVLTQLVNGLPQPVYLILSFAITAAAMVPMLGVAKGVLGYFRGKPLTFDCIQGMFPHAWKVICLYFWEMLCIMGWMLPGMAVMVVGGTMIAVGTNGTAIIMFGGLLMVAGIALMLVLCFRALLNYSMVNCILVDDPGTGARNCLRQSKEMIRGYRWHYVKVGLPMFFIILAAALIVSVVSSALPGWVGTLLNTAVTAVSGMMSYYFIPAMYEALKRIGR